ncbi:MAG: 23S rRNA (pseudouridine(1915)-N(3))-methyltransferase RlmH [Clostridia bacterium]|nr:23S rRNA (pseudouridine(1915)-N(3))-methyltransferase RlmH [Clostridia bacterium]
MTDIVLIHVGDFREDYFRAAEAEYLKRLKGYCRFRTVCIPEERIPDDGDAAAVTRALKRESEKIRAALNALPPQTVRAALCVEGRQMTSEAFASWMEGRIREGPVCFLIGSSHGLDEGLKKDCSVRISLSEMTFPHRLARLLLEEQVYRAFTILAGKTYHK